jgi:hypothetical protein
VGVGSLRRGYGKGGQTMYTHVSKCKNNKREKKKPIKCGEEKNVEFSYVL